MQPALTVDGLATGTDVLFLLMGAILVFAMHGGFAFLEVGTVRRKNQVNALVKIIADFAISTVASARWNPARRAADSIAWATPWSAISTVAPQVRQIRNWCGWWWARCLTWRWTSARAHPTLAAGWGWS